MDDAKEQEERRRRWKRRSQQAEAQTLKDLEEIEAARGYAAGWARHVWQARQKRERRMHS